jgi:exopolysaccharide production protein ExoQ
MPKIYSSKRPSAAPQRPGAINRRVHGAAARYVAPAVRQVKDSGSLALIAILFWLIFYMNLPDNLDGFAGNSGPIQTANIFARNIKVGMIVMSAYIIATRWSLARSLAKNINVGAAAILVLAPLSAVWSIEPAATLLRFISLAAVALVCFAACLAGWNPRRFQQLAIPPLMFILIGSLVVGMVLPDRIAEIGDDISQRNAWHGITHGKNEFGMVASFGVIICVNRWLAREGRTYRAIAGAAAAFACLILSRSNTSLFATIVAVASMMLVMRVPAIKRRYSTLVVVTIAATILLYALVIQNVIPGVNTLLAPIMSLTGKDMTFSARSIIWNVIKEHIQAAPYLGTGYGAYWLGPFPTSPSYVFISLMFFYPMESHNGYLEIINDLGFVGLTCLLVFLCWFMRQALQLMRTDRSQAALYLALLFQEMVINLSESDWFSRTNTFAVFLLAATCLSRGLLNARAATRPVGSPGR